MLDRVKGAMFRAVKGVFTRIDYYGKYRAKVISQSADGKKLDLKPDDVRLPQMKDVPLRLGLPGLEVKVPPGGYVNVGWEGGDPRKRYCEAWDPGASATEITIVATASLSVEGASVSVSASGNLELDGNLTTLNGGVLPVARQTDTAGPYPIVGGNPTVLA